MLQTASRTRSATPSSSTSWTWGAGAAIAEDAVGFEPSKPTRRSRSWQVFWLTTRAGAATQAYLMQKNATANSTDSWKLISQEQNKILAAATNPMDSLIIWTAGFCCVWFLKIESMATLPHHDIISVLPSFPHKYKQEYLTNCNPLKFRITLDYICSASYPNVQCFCIYHACEHINNN
jgi:hypothetical protein